MNRHHFILSLLLLGTGCPSDDGEAADTGNAESEADSGTEAGSESGESESGDATALDIIGEYGDNFGGHHEITMDTWVYDSGMGVFTTNLVELDNDAGWVAGEDASMPGTFVRFDWTFDDAGTLYYCQPVFDATTLQDAIDAPLTDASDPANGGCGGMFPWTTLTPV